MKFGRVVSRFWFYFRTGYSTYFTFLLGYVSTLVTVYYLAIKNMPEILDLFPHFSTFIVVGTLIGVPMATVVGWLHLKRTPAWTAEMDISAEANPYNYRLYPGYWKEVFTPLYLELLRHDRKLLTANNLLTPEDEKTISELEQKLETLISGSHVGKPRRKWV